jgi:hypothetical protein
MTMESEYRWLHYDITIFLAGVVLPVGVVLYGLIWPAN